MSKKIIIPAVVVVLVAVFVIAKMAGGGNKVTLEWEKKPVKEQTVGSVNLNVFVENSGSMDGYMCAGSNLKDAVFDYVSDIKCECSKMALYYINSQIIPCKMPLEDYIQNLSPESFAKAGGNRSNTDLRRIFEQILQIHKNNTVSVFVSDCILDIPENALDFFGNCQVSIKNSFRNALDKNPNLGVQILKMQSKFSGFWFCGKNKEQLTNVKRPYYIWLIGDKHILANINRKAPYTEIIGGIDKYCAFSNPDVIPFDIDKSRYTVPHTNKIHVDILADLSCSLQSENVLADCNNYSVGNPTQVRVISSARITAKGSKYDRVLTLELESPQSLNSETIKVSFPSVPSWVNATNDESWDNVKQNMDKTTGIYYLINGVAEAFNSSVPYGEIKFNIKK